MSDLRELYQEIILEHNKKPRNFRVLEDANRTAQGFNPLCGDRLTLYLKIEDGVVKDVAFQGSGCAISKASASMMTMSVKGKTAKEVNELFQKIHTMLARNPDSAIDTEELGRLGALAGVCEFPARVKCASLAWHTLKSGLEEEKKMVTTE